MFVRSQTAGATLVAHTAMVHQRELVKMYTDLRFLQPVRAFLAHLSQLLQHILLRAIPPPSNWVPR